MELVDSIDALRRTLRTVGGCAIDGQPEAARGKTVGLVPTMGNLHAGHMALVQACRQASDICVVSIFVNPTQFGPGEDFASYPRTLEDDLAMLAEAPADLVFKPDVDEMYPDGQTRHTQISVPALTDTLCGADRPGHFDGVATVVAKLFNVVAPDRAFFGEKDWQQLAVIRTMVRQLNMPVDVVGIPTVRAEDGLALSSRNRYLSDDERRQAPLLNATLMRLKASVERGRTDFHRLEASAAEALSEGGFDVDYVAIRDATRLAEPDTSTSTLRALAAARLGAARLIDNVGVRLPR